MVLKLILLWFWPYAAPWTVGLNSPILSGYVCDFNYCIHKTTFYEELPEVNIISKATFHQYVILQIFMWSIFCYCPLKSFGPIGSTE
jgi:hypothetical protein